jgi:hypothetical protein
MRDSNFTKFQLAQNLFWHIGLFSVTFFKFFFMCINTLSWILCIIKSTPYLPIKAGLYCDNTKLFLQRFPFLVRLNCPFFLKQNNRCEMWCVNIQKTQFFHWCRLFKEHQISIIYPRSKLYRFYETSCCKKLQCLTEPIPLPIILR